MPKLEKIRLSNISYNDAHNVIANEIFDLNGSNTLMKLINGGGKSVMTQLLMSPFVSKPNYRNFPHRKFSDYFTSSTPSWIVLEWQLENNTTRIVTGIVVRRNTVTKADSSEDSKLDVRGFIGEYEEGCPYTLENLPLVQTSGGKRGFVSAKEANSMLESYRKQYPGLFDFYNLNDTYSRRSYQEKLRSYGISVSEWDQMRAFNQEESGLSKFGETYDTEAKLIRGQFLEAIEKKIDEISSPKGESVIETLKENTTALLQMQINNQDTIIQQKDRNRFYEFLAQESGQTKLLAEYEQQYQDQLLALLSFLKGLNEALGQTESQLEEQTELREEAIEDLNLIELETYSAQYWQKEDQKLDLQARSQSLKNEIASLQEKSVQEEEHLNAMRLGKEYHQLQKSLRRKTEYTSSLEALKLENEELQKQIDEAGGRLNYRYSLMVHQEQESLDQSKVRLSGMEEKTKVMELEQEQASQELSTLMQQAASQKTLIEQYEKREQNFSQKYSLPIHHSLSAYEDDSLMESIQQRLAKEKDDLEISRNKLADQLEKGQKRVEELTEKQNSIRIDHNQMESKIQIETEKKQKTDEMLENRQQLLKRLELEEDELWDLGEIERQYQLAQSSLSLRMQDCQERQGELKREREQLETGCTLDLSDPIRHLMEDLEIPLLSGVEWLRSSRMQARKKEQMISKFPFLPYSLIMSREERLRFFGALQQKELYTSMPIPIIERDSLNSAKGYQLPDDLAVSFYLHFNQQLIQPAKRDELLEKNQAAIAHEQKLYQQLQMEKDKLADIRQISDLNYSKEDYDKLCTILLDAKDRLNQLAIALQENTAAMAHQKADNQKTKDSLNQKEKQLISHQKKLEAYQELLSAYYQTVKVHALYVTLEKQAESQKEQLASLKLALTEQRKAQTQAQAALHEQTTRFRALKDKASQYVSYPAIENEESLDQLEPVMDGLLSKQDIAAIKNLQKDLNETIETIQEQTRILSSMEESYGIPADVYEKLDPDVEQTIQQEALLKSLRKELDDKKADDHKLETRIAVLESNQKTLMENIHEVNPEADVLPKHEISAQDLQERKTDAKNRLDSAQNSIREMEDRKLQIDKLQDKTKIKIPEELDPDAVDADMTYINASIPQMKSYLYEWEDQQKSIAGKRDSLKGHIRKDMERHMGAYENDPLKNSEKSTKALVQDVLRDLLDQLDQPIELHRVLLTKMEMLKNILDQLNADLQNLEVHKGHTTDSIYDFVEKVYRHMNMIDRDTTVEMYGKPIKMLTITQPSFTDSEALFKSRIRDYLDELTSRVLNNQNQSDLNKEVDSNLRITALYDYVIGIQNVHIKTYKIGAFDAKRINWNEASRASGAEGFICSFAVVGALLNYRRQNPNNITKKRSSTALIMDNPFAKSQSQHIIEIFIQLALKMHIQIIAFTAVENSVILNAFNNIYNLRLNKHLDQKLYIESDHIKSSKDVYMEPFHMEVREEPALSN